MHTTHAANVIPTHVESHTVNPGVKGFVGLQVLESLEHPHKDLLGEVGGFVSIADHLIDQIVDAAFIEPKDLCKGLGISFPCLPQQVAQIVMFIRPCQYCLPPPKGFASLRSFSHAAG